MLWFQVTITPWFPIRPSAAWHCHVFHTHVAISFFIAIIPFIVGINQLSTRLFLTPWHICHGTRTSPGGIGLPGGYRCATGQKTKFQVEDLILFYYLMAPGPPQSPRLLEPWHNIILLLNYYLYINFLEKI